MAAAIAEAVRDARRDSTTPRLKSLGKARLLRASDLLLDLLRTGRMTRFERDFCALTDLPHHVAYSAMRKSGAKGVAILCKAFGFQRAFLAKCISIFTVAAQTPCFGRPSNIMKP